MESPLVSIIVPIYNVEPYLRRCLDSLLGQTLGNIEFILVNDGSTDNSLDICNEYVLRDSRFSLINKENGGPSDARNVGLSCANGAYIGFVDPDDWVSHDMYEYLLNGIQKYNADIAVCDYYNVWQWNAKSVRRVPINQVEVYRGKAILEALLTLKIANYAWNKLYKKELWDSGIRYPKGKKYEDVRTTYKLFSIASAIVSLPEPKYFYLRRENSISGSAAVSDLCECVESRMRRYETLDDVSPSANDFMLQEISKYLSRLRKSVANHPEKDFDACIDDIRYIASFVSAQKDEMIRSRGWRKPRQYMFELLGSTKRRDWIRSYYLFRALKQWSSFTEGRVYKSLIMRRSQRADANLLRGYYCSDIKKPIKRKSAFIESRFGEDLAGNMLPIIEDLLARNWSVAVCAKKINKKDIASILESHNLLDKVSIVSKKSADYFHALGTSELLFNDAVFPDEFVKRDDQIYVNTWHGTPLKYLEFDILDQRHILGGGARDRLKTDYLVVPNDFLYEKLLSSSHTDKLCVASCIKTGYPRNEIFFNSGVVSEIREKLSIGSKDFFVYMPTWRGTQEQVDDTTGDYSINLILDFFEQTLNDNQVIYVNLHNYSKESFDCEGYKKVFAFPKEYAAYSILAASDCLITDYSSVMFDYLNSRNKIILFTYDYNHYMKERGLYIDLDTLPFPRAESYDELKKHLTIQKEYDDENVTKEFCEYDSENSTSLLLDKLVADLENRKKSTKASPPKNILLYDSWCHQRYAFPDSIVKLLESLQPDGSIYYYGFRQWASPKTPLFMKNLPEYIRLFSFSESPVFFGKRPGSLFVDNKECIDAELRAQLGNAVFDAIYILGDNKYDEFSTVLKEHPAYIPGDLT